MVTSRLSNSFWLVLIILSIVVVAAFALARQQTTQQASNYTDGDLEELLISLERTTCYGNCPSYKLVIHVDGRDDHERTANAKLTNKKAGHAELVDVNKIVAAFDKANYLTIKRHTYDPCTC